MPEEEKYSERPIVEFQAKEFEMADLFTKIESARLMLWKACWAMDMNEDFRLDAVHGANI